FIQINNNNFEFQNAIYSNILGEEIRLFEPIYYQVIEENGKIDYIIDKTPWNDLVYGLADVDNQDVELHIDGIYRCNYQRWLSYRVFNIGKASDEHTISFRHQSLVGENQVHPVFYRLDMGMFQDVITYLKNNAFEVSHFSDGNVEGRITVEEDGNILLTIPNERGWKAYVNGKRVNIKTGCNALIMLPVEQGENSVKLIYQLPYLKLGTVISI
ncbi:YfhO family protein, partial [Clostridium sp. AM58-1XD]|uniref:YfhO family protein n=1 Tax=Clostridium sp. AM58-1XD TaxID=2292307 RepID=UPI000EE2458F